MYAYAANNPVKYTDPDGRETRKGVHLNLLPKNEEHYFYANDKILQNDKYYVAAHGNPKAIYEYLNASEEATSRGKSRPISPEELVERIKSDPNYSEGMTVVIWACNTGKNEKDSYAQKVANALGKGAKVIAPNAYYFISKSPNKTNFVGQKKENGFPDLNKPGRMLTFIGEELNE